MPKGMNKGGHILLIGIPGPETNILFHALTAEFTGTMLVFEQAVPRTRFLLNRIRRYGLVKAAGQAMFMMFITPLLGMFSASRKREIIRQSGLNTASPPFNRKVRSINSDEVVNLIREKKPFAIVVCGTRIVSGKVLSASKSPFLNIHAGITPQYRGVHGAYWALAEGKKEMCGVTVHLLDEGIDTGPVISQAVITPGPEDNFVTYPYLQLAAGIPLLVEALRKIQEGSVLPVLPTVGVSRLLTHPTLWGYLWTRFTTNAR